MDGIPGSKEVLNQDIGQQVAETLWGNNAENVKRSVENSGGAIFLVVHQRMTSRKAPQLGLAIEESISQFISSQMPVIIFEEDNVLPTAEVQAAKIALERPIAYVPTEWLDPRPSFKFPAGGKERASFKNIRELFAYLGVKHVSLSGMYLSEPKRATRPIEDEVGCVNGVYKALRGGPWSIDFAFTGDMPAEKANSLTSATRSQLPESQ